DLRFGHPRGPRPPALLRWLRDRDDPRQSYWAERQSGLDEPNRPERGPVLDRAAVLLAALCWPVDEEQAPQPLFAGQGLRIIVQVGRPKEESVPVRISGVSSTLPPPRTARIELDMLLTLPERVSFANSLTDEVKVVDTGVYLPEEKDVPIIFARTAPAEE